MLFAHITHLILVLVLHLSLLVAKVLLLGLDDNMELCFLSLDLLDQLLEVGNFLEVLNFLRGDLLVEKVLLFLVSDLTF